MKEMFGMVSMPQHVYDQLSKRFMEMVRKAEYQRTKDMDAEETEEYLNLNKEQPNRQQELVTTRPTLSGGKVHVSECTIRQPTPEMVGVPCAGTAPAIHMRRAMQDEEENRFWRETVLDELRSMMREFESLRNALRSVPVNKDEQIKSLQALCEVRTKELYVMREENGRMSNSLEFLRGENDRLRDALPEAAYWYVAVTDGTYDRFLRLDGMQLIKVREHASRLTSKEAVEYAAYLRDQHGGSLPIRLEGVFE